MKRDYKNLLLIIMFVFVLGISINVFAGSVAQIAEGGGGSATCTGVFSDEFLEALRDYVYKPIKIATPVLLLVLTSFDFAKVVFAGKKEDMDKAKNNFLKRAVAAVIIFLAPDVVRLIVDLVQNNSIKSCINSLT